jgi:uncharacterized protein YjiK
VRALAFVALVSLGCGPAVPDAAATPSGVEQVPSALAEYDFERPSARFDLPGRLDEISGLALTDDGRLFAHDDERGRIHEVDPVTGEVGKRFDLGGGPVQGDFEGIAAVGDRLFLVTSIGFLYEFREGDDGQDIGYRVTDLGVRDVCEVEGLDHDAVDDVLLVSCKVSAPDRGEIVVHRFPVDPTRAPLPPLRIAKAGMSAFGLDPDFEASAIVAHPSGNLLLVAGPQDVLIEVDRSGNILAAVDLARDRHPQPEGLEIGADGALYVSDERNGRAAHLTVYAPRGTAGPA